MEPQMTAPSPLAVPGRSPGVPAAVQHIEERIANLDGTLATLLDRLATVLGESQPKPTPPQIVGVREGECALADGLHGLAGRIGQMQATAADVLERLQL